MIETGETSNQRNLAAWDELYGSTPELIWGSAPVGFLAPFLAPEIAGGRSLGRVLDAATGEGRNLPVLLAAAEEVSACDGAAAALAKIPVEVKARVRCECCELDETPFADESFDYVLLCDTVETLPEPMAALRELRRITAPGGRLICNIPGPEGDVAGVDMIPLVANGYLYRSRFYYRFFSDEAAMSLLAEAGWRVVRDELMEWEEEPHPEFRANAHRHRSHVYLLEPAIHGS